ncbi:hypothetical protein HWV62_7222 [Athelia sp. TMB]|nr:hypothetical protein HWV62_7222 [Athelia sp. TMB]
MNTYWPESGRITSICEPSPDDFTLCFRVLTEHPATLSIGFLDAGGSVRVSQVHQDLDSTDISGLKVEELLQCEAHKTRVEFAVALRMDSESEGDRGAPSPPLVWAGGSNYWDDEPPCGCESAFGLDEDNEVRHYGLHCTFND